MICCDCGQEMRYTDETLREDHNGTPVDVDGIGHWVCDSCGCVVMTAEETERLGQFLEAYAEDTGRYE